MSKTTPIIAVTSGDPAGIGPEIVTSVFHTFRPSRSVALIIGAPEVFAASGGLNCPVVKDVDALRDFDPQSDGPVAMLHTGVGEPFPVGEDSRGGGMHAGRAVEIACDLARGGRIRAIVTAPASKKSLNLADFHFGGHTEMLAQYLNAPDCQMMMVYKNLRVVPMTRHVPVREISDRVIPETLTTCIRQTHQALRDDFGIDAPRIAVSGLNPHAGEGGVIGTEDDEVIAGVVANVSDQGWVVEGPVPADALFQRAHREHGEEGRVGSVDAYITMYHDQGLIPFKMLSQRRGVNVTVGLPVIRTSVDHGVAYDIAGTGAADIASMRAAYDLAEEIAIRRTEL